MDITIERRCQVGLHNFPKRSYNSVICQGCMYIKLPNEYWYETIHEPEEDKNVVLNAFKGMNVGHECRDGTINYNKTW